MYLSGAGWLLRCCLLFVFFGSLLEVFVCVHSHIGATDDGCFCESKETEEALRILMRDGKGWGTKLVVVGKGVVGD